MNDIKQVFKDALVYFSWKDSLYIDFVLMTKIIDKPDLPAAMGIRATPRELELFVNFDEMSKLQLAKDDIYQLLRHEYAHVLLKHVFVQLPNHDIDNIAADMEINQNPWTQMTNKVKEWCITYETFRLDPSKSRESYYDELIKNNPPPKGGSGGKNGQGKNSKNSQDQNGQRKLDEHFFDGNNDAAEQVWSGIVEKVLEQAKNKGLLPGDVIEEILARWKPHPSLKQILKRIVGKYYAQSIVEGSSRLRPNRRFPLIPGSVERFGPQIVFAIDTSGSMCSKDLADICSVIRWVQKKMSVVVLQCDAEIKDVSAKVKTVVKVKGRGGTSFKPVFKYITDKLKDKIDLLIYATDLYGDFPDEKPRYPVLWLSTDTHTDEQVPFGKIIKLNKGG